MKLVENVGAAAATPLSNARITRNQELYADDTGLCAERCPTAAWDMQAFWYNVTKAGHLKYGPTVVGNVVQITRNGNGSRR